MMTLYDFLQQGYIDDWIRVNIFYVERDGSIDHNDDDEDDIVPYFQGEAADIPYYLLDTTLVSKETQEKADIEGAVRPITGGEWGLNIFVEDVE